VKHCQESLPQQDTCFWKTASHLASFTEILYIGEKQEPVI